MSFFDGVLLGLVQGLTEFLPVSSSGHLVIMQSLLNFRGPALVFDTLLHLGTLSAVLVYFHRDLAIVGRSLWRLASRGERDTYTSVALYLVVATIPAAVAGVLFEDLFTEAFNSVLIVGFMLILTGMLLWAAEAWGAGTKELEKLTFRDSVFVGLAQAIAIMPGISRSGATIAAGMFRGVSREAAARFSFLLSIPIILGASGYALLKHGSDFPAAAVALGGVAAAALSGFVAISLLMKLIREQRLRLFSVYCFIVGGAAIAASLAA